MSLIVSVVMNRTSEKLPERISRVLSGNPVINFEPVQVFLDKKSGTAGKARLCI